MEDFPREKIPYRILPVSPLFFSREYPARLFLNDHIPWLNIPCSGFIDFSGSMLVVPAFRVRKNRQIYVFPEMLYIDLRGLESGIYRVVAVQNFKIEDFNPRLDECPAGIFLARKVGDKWEESENSFHECRTIQILGYLDTERGGFYDIEL